MAAAAVFNPPQRCNHCAPVTMARCACPSSHCVVLFWAPAALVESGRHCMLPGVNRTGLGGHWHAGRGVQHRSSAAAQHHDSAAQRVQAGRRPCPPSLQGSCMSALICPTGRPLPFTVKAQGDFAVYIGDACYGQGPPRPALRFAAISTGHGGH